ncbi:hypothetical protein LTR37_011519 [Vermiconidia calcicola]|uniref:Uncharacterized protein n=1 Tax=Vermiconidia calcicola TaxID=1690605 RepID=A0ACC3N3G1_9PEZI|nr:hypothetical protein LTR37_011519 [Vermiconidia calcicola]
MAQLEAMIEDSETRRHLKCITLSHACLVDPQEDYQRRQFKLSTALKGDRTLQSRLRKLSNILRRSILRLRKSGIDVGIRCTETGIKLYYGNVGNPEDPAPWGYDRLCERLGYRGCLDKQETDHRAFRAILSASSVTSHAPPVLELGNKWNGLPIQSFNRLWLGPRLEQQLFCDLETLRLGLTLGRGRCHDTSRAWTDDEEQVRSEVDGVLTSFRETLYDAPQLRTLGLTILDHSHDDECLGEEVFLHILAVDLLSNLRVLELSRDRINMCALLTFVLLKKGTLRSIYLRRTKDTESRFAVDVFQLPENAETSALLCDVFQASVVDCDVTWEQVYDGEKWRQPSSKEVYV